MLHAREILLAGVWDAAEAFATATLAYEHRWLRRRRIQSDRGEDILVDLPHALVLNDGDGLVVGIGRVVRVLAAREALLEVTCADPRALARIAWHLGNRHTPAAIEAARILVQHDHVLADMLKGLGAEVREVIAPFNPERGAYAGGGHHHGRGHDA